MPHLEWDLSVFEDDDVSVSCVFSCFISGERLGRNFSYSSFFSHTNETRYDLFFVQGTEYGRIELRTDRPAKELTGWRAITLHPER